jgi:hypothetical protein
MMFKKIMLSFLISFFFACGNLYADDVLDLHKQEQSLTIPKRVEMAMAKSHSRAKSDTWESSNPDDLKPLADSTWLFIYEIGSATFTETVVFSDEITNLDDGSVAVMCVTKNGMAGMAEYMDLSDTEGNGFRLYLLEGV